MGGGEAARRIAARLRTVAVGLLSVLNRLAFEEARTDFPTLLVTDPLRAYRVILRYTRGDRWRARTILRVVLLGVADSVEQVERAVDALDHGDPRPLLRLLHGKG